MLRNLIILTGILLVSLSSCTRSTYYAPVAPIFVAVDSTEDISITLRPGALQLRIVPVRYLFVAGGAWHNIIGSQGAYSLSNQGGMSQNLGIGIFSGDLLLNKQLIIEGGLCDGAYTRKYTRNLTYMSYLKSERSYYGNGSYLKIGFLFNRQQKGYSGIGLQIQRQFLHRRIPLNISTSGPTDYEITGNFDSQFVLSYVGRRNIKYFSIEYQFGVGGTISSTYQNQYSSLPFLSFQIGVFIPFRKLFDYK